MNRPGNQSSQANPSPFANWLDRTSGLFLEAENSQIQEDHCGFGHQAPVGKTAASISTKWPGSRVNGRAWRFRQRNKASHIYPRLSPQRGYAVVRACSRKCPASRSSVTSDADRTLHIALLLEQQGRSRSRVCDLLCFPSFLRSRLA